MNRMMVVVALLVVVQLVGTAFSCSVSGSPKDLGMVRALYKAPAVVIATDVYHSDPVDQEGGIEAEDNYAIMAVECIMKSGGYDITRNITIWEGAVRETATCQRTVLKVGIRYVIGLELRPEVSEDRFFIYEPNVMTPGGYEATSETLNAAAQICGLDEPQAMEGAGSVDEVCPSSTAEECTSGMGSVLTSVTMMNWCTVLCLLYVTGTLAALS